MAIKTEVRVQAERPKKAPFPTLRRSINGGAVVMFTGPMEGVVLADPENNYGVGHYSGGWTSAGDDMVWERVESVTITEEE